MRGGFGHQYAIMRRKDFAAERSALKSSSSAVAEDPPRCFFFALRCAALPTPCPNDGVACCGPPAADE